MRFYFTIVLWFFCGLSLLSAQDLYNINSVKDIKITFEAADWEFKLDSLKAAGNDDRLLANVTVNGVYYPEVGVRYKGNSSYHNVRNLESIKLPFNIKANYIRKDQTFAEGVKTLKLSNVFRDPSFLREVLSYEIVGNYMPAPRANFIRLYVNDQYLGLYNSTESVDGKFLTENFDHKSGTLIKCDPDWHGAELKDCPPSDKASLMYLGEDTICYRAYYEMKSDSGWTDLVNLTRVLNKDLDKIETVLDVDQTLWMLAYDNILVNLDSYIGRLCHNYYLYQGADSVFHPIVWDMNLSFGGFRFDGIENRELTLEELQKLSPFLHYKQQNPKRPLITNLLSVPLYRKVYIAHLKTILNDYFTNGKYLERAKFLQQQIDWYVKNDENKLYQYPSFKQNLHATTKAGKSQIVGISELMSARTAYLSNHPLIRKSAPTISQVQHLQTAEGDFLVSAKVDIAENVYLVYRADETQAFQKVLMLDNGEKGDRQAGDKVYSFALEKSKIRDYYLIAEGEKNASLSPERASKEFYKTVVY